MSTENAKIRIRNRLREIKWTTQYADHILDNYINDPTQHDLKFQEISDMLRHARIDHIKGNKWYAYGMAKERKYLAVLILTPKFVIVQTCYRHGWTI